MQNLMETLTLSASVIAVCLVILILALNLYWINKNGIYVRVNCWFCNSWTKAPYAKRNSFNCPSCQQYNGFKEDGGYNKVIKAQHATLHNKHNLNPKTESVNGLCTYCNNNQQLKIYQLANFTPLNEANYDLEVEHFRKQLEKAYKLCKKCENVLKATLDRQHAWIFGNRLKSLQRKGLAFINGIKSQRKELKQNFYTQFIRLACLLILVLIIWHIMNIKIDYPYKDIKKYVPKVFQHYYSNLTDKYHGIYKIINASVNNQIESLSKYLPQYIKLEPGYLTFLSATGFLLESLVSHRNLPSKKTKISGWILLVFTSVLKRFPVYSHMVNLLQVCCSIVLFLIYFSNKQTKSSLYSKKKCEFRKLKKSIEVVNETDEEDADEEEDNRLSTSSSSSKSKKSLYPNLNGSYSQHCYRTSSPTYDYPNNFIKKPTTSLHNDLNQSLDNLHLRPEKCISPIFSVRRPILSPPKLKTITQNPWTAGGFWKNDINALPVPTIDHRNFSRASSHSSGFVSNNNPFSSLPVSREPSVCGDVERSSILSEPPYHFQPINSNTQQLYYKSDNTFYPVLNQNNMLFLQTAPVKHHFENCFGSVPPKGFGMDPLVINNVKPISNLFKNIQTLPRQQSKKTL